ncbi:MAG: SufS family cysteine desulfurase [Candidatus Doudnabacteria bacterium]|nr:SufS family cysteine desulfurase [Candidatus Doudnabacteria bacterium]
MNLHKLRKEFPILHRKINGRPLVYFDNASTTQKPRSVINAMSAYYSRYNANIHRGIHTLSQEATTAFEQVRDEVKTFLNARAREEIVFTSGATESLNLVAAGLEKLMKRGSEIILTEAEHHSNIVPWQILAQKTKTRIKYIPLTSQGRPDFGTYRRLLSKKTAAVSVSHASNVTGVIAPIKKIVRAARKTGTLVVVDAAQSAAHLKIDVQNLDCDFLAFSGHKIYGPTGIGVLYGKKHLLARLAPFKYGGHMIAKVTKEKTSYATPPEKFEGGTMPIAEVIGLGAALEFLERIGFAQITRHEQALTRYALKKLLAIPGLKLLGPTSTDSRLPIFSFTLSGIPAHDIASILDSFGVQVRSGHHCAQILHTKFHLEASTRISLGIYNTKSEIDSAIKSLRKTHELFRN